MKSKNRITKLLTGLIFVLAVLAAAFAARLPYAANAASSDAIAGDDGVYRCSYDVGGTTETGKAMVVNNCEPTVTVEKITQNGAPVYYVSFVIKAGQSMSDIAMTLDGRRLGLSLIRETADGDNRVHTYMIALSDGNIRRAVGVSAYVAAMNRSVTFTISVALASAEYLGATPEYDGERPAQFVPTLSVNYTDGELLKQGSVYSLPAASADFGEVSVAVYFGDGREEVAVTDGKFTLVKAGYYTVVYTAASGDYLTSAGNPAATTLTFTVQASSNGGVQQNTVWENALGTVEDLSSAVTGYAELSASRLTSGETFESAQSALNGSAAKFSVISLVLTNDGSPVALGGAVKVSLAVPTTYDKSNTAVYLLDNGVLTEMAGSFSGSYFVFETERLGAFVIAEKSAARSGCGSAVGSLFALTAAVSCAGVAIFVRRGKKA